MTSEEIKATHFFAGPDQAYLDRTLWIKEIAYQLAVLNETRAIVPELVEALRELSGRAQGLLEGEPDTQELWDKLGPEIRNAQRIMAKVYGRQ